MSAAAAVRLAATRDDVSRMADDIGGAVAVLPAIGLDELNVRAALQTRVDRKYLVDRTVVRHLIGLTAGAHAVLQIDGRRSFGYQSVYFDTPDLLCFRDHRAGRRRRFKVRTRLYRDSGQSMLEVKTKGLRGATVKTRRDWDTAAPGPLTGQARDFVGAALTEAGYDAAPIVGGLTPSLVTDYRRISLVDLAAGSRATIDGDLAFAIGNVSVHAPARTVIVETKSTSGAGRIDRELRRLGVRPVSVSKYCVGIALTRPQLPANPWERLLRRHFSAAPRGSFRSEQNGMPAR